MLNETEWKFFTCEHHADGIRWWHETGIEAVQDLFYMKGIRRWAPFLKDMMRGVEIEFDTISIKVEEYPIKKEGE